MEMSVNFLTLSAGEPTAMDTEVAGKSEPREEVGGDRGVVSSGERLVAPFVPALLEYLNRVIGGTVVKGGGRSFRDRGRNLEKEFVVLSR